MKSVVCVVFTAVVMSAAPAFAFEVSGLVRNQASQPIAGVDIDAFDSATGNEVAIPSGDTTDVDGTFLIDLGAGTYDLTFTPLQGSGLAGFELTDRVVSGNTVLPTVTLEAGYVITLRVTDLAGQPVDQVVAQFDDSGGSRVFTPRNTSDVQGLLETVVPPSRSPFTLYLRDVSARGFAQKEFIDFSPTGSIDLGTIIMGPAQAFTGRTIRFDNGLPISDVDIDVYDQSSGLELKIDGDLTAGDGTFSVTGLSSGRYMIFFRPPNATGLDRVEFRKVRVDGPLDMGDVILGSLAVVSGRVLGPSLTPIDSADLDFVDQSQGFEIEVNNDNTGAAGTFATEVNQGTYTIIVNPPAGLGLAPKTIFNVAVGMNIDLGDIVLTGAVTLSGQVKDFQGQPVENADLDVIDPVTGFEIQITGDKSDPTGFYTATLEPGTWDLRFAPPVARGDLGPVDLSGFVLEDDQTLDITLPQSTSSVVGWIWN